jgi:Tol biopolymer transport system component
MLQKEIERMRIGNIAWPALFAGGILFVFGAPLGVFAQTSSGPVGIFEGHGDVGVILHPGSVDFDAAAKTYTISGSGDNIWAVEDDFHYVWKKVSGDVSLTADIAFMGTGGNEHRKGVLMMRQTLDQDSPYADIAVHGVGLTSLQARAEKGAATHEVQANQTSPKRARIVKRGQYFYMWLSDGGDFQFTGGAMKIALADPFYVGIGVSSHNKDVVEKVRFSNVDVSPLPPVGKQKPDLYSAIETITVSSTDRHVTMVAPGRLEAPTWTKDGKTLIFDSDGRIERVAEPGGKPEMVDTGAVVRAGSAHAISPDGMQLAFSGEVKGKSGIYIEPAAGSQTPRLVAPVNGSVRGWSPDGRTLLYAASSQKGRTDIFTVPASGGKAVPLTTTGMEDFPEYAPDGKYIYFQSSRGGPVEIWRMKPDGSGQEQVTPDDGYNNWFAHVSPDSARIAFVTFNKDVPADQHPPDKEVMLRMMTLADKKITVLTKLFGGQGTMNVNSWSPDGRKLAFVSYQYIQ